MSLHDEIETYEIKWYVKTILHAKVDLGQLTDLTCAHPSCRLPGVPFPKKASRGQRDCLSLDHIVPQRDGGSHRPGNLRIVHGACNYGWRLGLPAVPHSLEAIEKIREGNRRAWQDGRHVDNSDPARNARLSAAMTAKYATGWRPDQTPKDPAASFARRSGAQQRSWSDRDRSPTPCECGAGPFRGTQGLRVHVVRTHV